MNNLNLENANDDFKKIPNWLRYILAIPYGFIAAFIIVFIISIGIVLFARRDIQDSALFFWRDFVFWIINFYSFKQMIPNHKKILTIIYSVIILIMCVLFITILHNSYKMGLILTSIAAVIVIIKELLDKTDKDNQ